MRRVMVRYTVKPGQAAANEKLVRAVYDELDQTSPGGLRYATLRLEDGLTFIHLAVHEDGTNPLLEVSAFRRFTDGIADRCEIPPQAAELAQIGNYRLFSG